MEETPQTQEASAPAQVGTETETPAKVEAAEIQKPDSPYAPDCSLGVVGPKDCRWPKDEKTVTTISIAKPTSFDGEQMQIHIPVFEGDTAEDVDMRFAALSRPLQARMVAMNQSMQYVEQEAIKENRKRELEKVAHQAEVKRLAKEKKKH